jgi:ankyrin repeat protein
MEVPNLEKASLTSELKNGSPKVKDSSKIYRGHKKGASSLHDAAFSGDVEQLKSIIKKGKTNINIAGSDQVTALHDAAFTNQGN